jgi:hypothetical protein
MLDPGDTITLSEELAYADVLPIAFRPLDAAPDVERLANWSERNLRLLQTSAALEERGAWEKADEESPNTAELARMDLKLNLLLEIVGHLLAASHPRPAACALRFNASGVEWEAAGAPPRDGCHGVVELHLQECLLQPLMFTGRVTPAAINGHTHVQFDAVPDAVADHIKKLVFRRHRRQVAGARQARRA